MSVKKAQWFQTQGAALAASVIFAFVMTAAIYVLTPLLSRFEDPAAGVITYDYQLPPGQGAAHYEWKLNEPTVWTRLSSWGLYALHQLSVWGLIAWAMLKKKRETAAGKPKYDAKWDVSGLVFFGLTVFFSLLHLLQTHVHYDGIAQDVAVFSSQASVVVMLVLILIIQNDRRGLIFGLKVPMPKAPVAFIRKYHGYYIAWALTYTFWFHPMTGTFGHLAGFLYMFLLFSQGTLMYTKTHVSLKWSAVLEGLVLLHGTTVAFVGQQSPMWTMFFSGFGFMVVATHLWGLKLPAWLNWVFGAVYLLVVGVLYSGVLSGLGPLWDKSITQVHQMLWIPITLYGLVPVFLLLAAALAWAGSLIGGKKAV